MDFADKTYCGGELEMVDTDQRIHQSLAAFKI
jgi:hypothetical protein